MGKMVALQCSVDDVETLKEVFRLTSLVSKFEDAISVYSLFRCDEATSDFCNML